MQKIEEVRLLVDKLNQCRDAYYNRSESLISDYEYDELFDKLAQLENETGIILSNSPTQEVGYKVVGELETSQHSHPMLSLKKTKLESDIVSFHSELQRWLSLKMDGLTVLLTYENGELVKAETRGDGTVGEVITHNAKHFTNIPLKINYDGVLEVEGEAIIRKDKLDIINKKEKAQYKNVRNLVSGSVRQLDSKIAASRFVEFVAWKVPTSINNMDSMPDRIDYINKNFGFEIVPYYLLGDKENSYTVHSYVENLVAISDKKSYPIDGLVVNCDKESDYMRLGFTEGRPRGAMAYKFYDEESVATLEDIEWTVGKTGIVTPTAIFSPVEIDGTTVTRASIHNVEILAGLNLAIGNNVTVYKANMIIPQISSNLNKNDNEEFAYVKLIPRSCPCCGEKLTLLNPLLMCKNPSCSGKLLGKLVHFCSKGAMDIDGLSESTLEKFIDLGLLNSALDLYTLKDHKRELMQLDGFGLASVNKILKSIEKSRVVSLDKFINSLSITSIGKTNSKQLAQRFKTANAFVEALDSGFNFTVMDGFGTAANNEIHKWYENTENKTLLISLIPLMKEITFAENVKSGNSLANMSFVITGKLNKFKNRDELVDKITENGGTVSSSVTKSTTFLINNDTESDSSKNKKAKSLGVRVISEDELISMIGE